MPKIPSLINNVNVVIMAGGKGSRLKSITENTPKALVEIEGKPVIVYLIEHLASFGCTSLHISVGHMADQIMAYLKNGTQFGLNINYLCEDVPLGSIGALALKREWDYDNFLVINGDVFTNFNVNEFISFFLARQADMAILTSLLEMEVPWGVVNMSEELEILSLVEKPKYPIRVSAGIYLFNKKIVHLLPSGISKEGWQLVQLALTNGHKIIGMPLENCHWVDIGTYETLNKARDIASMKQIQR
ncbi:sugar phosphate nucleotidyltransferase [Dyadobacter sp. CY312]|uniref:sugar phosphate nucleotidyltransferase n=1 Tax=Dyadobacter sp. CY312 TaxID=2907303 RepID=UPI001F3DFBEC|nr:sugar phosphate nucleotidyltransferase [Dyadobacter sp. CY312]MCE7039686.1 NTP transferase domain-containing protein [Dyadobacter sp. CY312]